MSLASYRAAPSRVTILATMQIAARSFPFWELPPQLRFDGGGLLHPALLFRDQTSPDRQTKKAAQWPPLKHVNGFFRIRTYTPASMPGDDLLFQCLSNSTIGAVRFHGRVRDGIEWGTDAMVTKQ